MLPDFPKTRREIARRLRLRTYLRAQERSPMRALGSTVTQHEGALHSYEQITDDGIRRVTEGLEEISVPIEVRFEDIPELVGEKLFKRIDAIAEDVARQTSQITFRKMDQTTREAGNVIDAAGGPPTKEIWLEMFSKMEMDFDPVTKKPEVTLVVHPVMAETMQKLWSEWQTDAAFLKRYEDMLAEKREEWRDRESRRKLVD